jgi:hypothetical protein
VYGEYDVFMIRFVNVDRPVVVGPHVGPVRTGIVESSHTIM